MATDRFSIEEAVRFGWGLMKRNIGFFIAFTLLALLLQFIPNGITRSLGKSAPVLAFLVGIIGAVVSLLVSMGWVRVSLKVHDGETPEYGNLFSCYPLLLRYLGASILYGLIVTGGFFLLIVPGIIWSIKFQFYAYFIVDEGAGVMESLRKSSAITQNVKWDVFLFDLLMVGINVLGALALMVGLLITVPTTMVATAYVYRRLCGVLYGPRKAVEEPVTQQL